ARSNGRGPSIWRDRSGDHVRRISFALSMDSGIHPWCRDNRLQEDVAQLPFLSYPSCCLCERLDRFLAGDPTTIERARLDRISRRVRIYVLACDNGLDHVVGSALVQHDFRRLQLQRFVYEWTRDDDAARAVAA